MDDMIVTRRNMYKVMRGPDEFHRTRVENVMATWQNGRERILTNRRRRIASLKDEQELREHLHQMINQIKLKDSSRYLDATIGLCKLVSLEHNPPIQEIVEAIIEAGMFRRLVSFLKAKGSPQLQFHGAWVLANIVSGTLDQTQTVIDYGAVPLLVTLVFSQLNSVSEQAVFALGNIAVSSEYNRDLVLSELYIPQKDFGKVAGFTKLLELLHEAPLLDRMNEHSRLDMLRTGTWTLSNLCGGVPPPAYWKVRPVLPTLERLLHSNDDEVLTDTCRALRDITNGVYYDTSYGINFQIQDVINSGVCLCLVQLFLHPSSFVQMLALQTVEIIVTTNCIPIQVIIDYNVLPCLAKLLIGTHEMSSKKMACSIISKINAGNINQIQAMIDANIIGALVQLLENPELDIKKEVEWALFSIDGSRIFLSGGH